MSDEFRKSVLQTIYTAYRTGRVTGTTVSKNIGKLTLAYKKKLTLKSPLKNVVDLPTFINNVVIDLKHQSLREQVPATGWITVTDGIKLLGLCEETGKVVSFVTTWACRSAQRFPYRRVEGVYYLENHFPGDVRKPIGWYGGMPGDWLLQEGTNCFEYFDPDDLDNEYLEHSWETSGAYEYPEQKTWTRTDGTFQDVIIAYVEDKVYKERQIDTPLVELVSIDLSSYLTDCAASGTESGNGYKNGTYHITNPEVIRMVHVGNFAILQVLREKRTYLRNVDPGCECANDYYAQGENAEAYNSVTIFNLLVIDIVEETVNELNFISQSTWFGLPPMTISGGYIDIQLDKETGELLYIKSDTSPSTASVSVSYYDCDHGICLPYNDPDEDEPYYDTSSSATTRRSGYTLYRAKLNTDTLDFYGATVVHSESASRSSIEGVSVSGGGLRSMTFTQQPESFNIFLRMHLVGYKMANKDWSYTPTNGDPTRIERWQRDLVCIGMMSFTTESGTELYSVPTAEIGVYPTCSYFKGLDENEEPYDDEYDIEHLTNVIVFNACAPIAKSYGFRSHWPDIEGNYGKGEYWPSGTGERDDYPTSGYNTIMLETRWAESWLGSSAAKPYKNHLIVGQLDAYPYPVPPKILHGTIGIRSDPDNFMAFTAAASDTGILFIWAGVVWVHRGRLRCDSENDFMNYVCIPAVAGHSESSIWLSDFDARDNRIEAMISFDEQEGIPHHTYYFTEDSSAGGNPWRLTVHEGFGNFSMLQLGEYFGVWFKNMQYQHFDYDPQTGASDPVIRRRISAAGFIASADQYYPSEDYEGNPEDVCLWMNFGAQHWEESPDGSLGFANISNKVLVKEAGELSMSGLYTP